MVKNPNDVRGRIINCPNFIQCPLCYGCRNFDTSDSECLICNKNKKLNICNIKLHTSDNISKMILKSNIVFKDKISFK